MVCLCFQAFGQIAKILGVGVGRLSAHECQTQAQMLHHRSGFLLAHSHHTTLIPDVTSYHMIVLLWLAKNNHHKWSWGGGNVSALFYTFYARFYSLQSFQCSSTQLLNDPLVTPSLTKSSHVPMTSTDSHCFLMGRGGITCFSSFCWTVSLSSQYFWCFSAPTWQSASYHVDHLKLDSDWSRLSASGEKRKMADF